MKKLSISDASVQLAQLVDAAASGEDVIIQKDEFTAVRLVRVEPAVKRPRTPGLLKGQIEIADDFDAPLPDDILAGFEGR